MYDIFSYLKDEHFEDENRDKELPDEVHLKPEEEQLKLLKEQQEEIDSLKAKLSGNAHDSDENIAVAAINDIEMNESVLDQDQTKTLEELSVETPITDSMRKLSNENLTEISPNDTVIKEESNSDGSTSVNETVDNNRPTSDTTMTENSDASSLTREGGAESTELEKKISSQFQTSHKLVDKSPDEGDSHGIYGSSATEEIMKEALRRTERNEQEAATAAAAEGTEYSAGEIVVYFLQSCASKMQLHAAHA